MRIICLCGEEFSLNTDFLYYRGHLIADQDYELVLEAIDTLLAEAYRIGQLDIDPKQRQAQFDYLYQQVPDTIQKRFIYQCPHCGRLHINDANYKSHIYKPENDQQSSDILRSIHRNDWKGKLKGNWARLHDAVWYGYLAWDTKQSRGWKIFDTWEELKSEYHRLLEDLKDKDMLATAQLQKDKDVIHTYQRDEG